MKLVKRVLSAEYSILKSNPVKLGINGIGETFGRGWKNGQLVQRTYANPPEDGIQDFEFYGELNEENECSKVGIISVIEICDVHTWMTGFRIHTASEVLFEINFSNYEKIVISADSWNAGIWKTVDLRRLLQYFQKKWSVFM